MQSYYRFVEDHATYFVSELQRLLREPSIFTNDLGISSTLNIIEEVFSRIGAKTQRLTVAGSKPYLLAEIGEGEKCVLIYNHYDVQPVEPLNQWESGPFLAEIRDGYLFARGAADNKGNLYTRIAAIESILQTKNKLPCKVKFLLDGEEEIGSPHIQQFMSKYGELIKSDICIWESGFMDQNGRLAVSLGLKGLAYLELRCQNIMVDIHSSWATIVDNSAWRLIHALSTVRGPKGNIKLDGLDEHIIPPTKEEKKLIKNVDIDLLFYKELFGLKDFLGSKNTDKNHLMQKHFFSPTCNICGIHSGYTKTETKTILPHEAWANVDFRLVPDLTPELVTGLLRSHLNKRGFDDIEITLKCSMPPYKSKSEKEAVDLAKKASVEVYHKNPFFIPMLAGSGPMYHVCAPQRLNVLSFGIAHPGSHIHAPNENIRIQDFINGIKFVGRLLTLLGSNQ